MWVYSSSRFWEDGETVVQKPLNQMKQEFDSLRYYQQDMMQREDVRLHTSNKTILPGSRLGMASTEVGSDISFCHVCENFLLR